MAGVLCPGQTELVTPESTAEVERTVMEDRRETASETDTVLNVSPGSAGRTIHRGDGRNDFQVRRRATGGA